MAYYDNAATTYPKPESVYKFMDDFYRHNGGNAGRGNYAKAANAGKLIADTRELVKTVLNCPAKKVVFEPTATIALNIILQGLIASGRVKNIYISPFEHNAVTRTLHHFEKNGSIIVKELCVGNDMHYDLPRIRYQFDEAKPDMVVVSHASNVCGLIAPVVDIFSIAKRYDALTVVDMSQTAGLVALNCGLQTIDFAVFAGHKTLYGPTGISGFVMESSVELPAVFFGGTGYESANQDMPESIPQKYEFGTTNISGIAGLHAALLWINEIGIDAIWKKEQEHRTELLSILQKYPFIKIIGNKSGNEYVGIVSCVFEGISSDSAGGILSERGISVRTGLECAPLAHKFLGTYPFGTIRFSVSYFTSEQDFKELCEALDDIEDNL